MNKINPIMRTKIQEIKNNSITNATKKCFQMAILLLLSFTSIQAQDKKAKDLLNEVTSKIKSYNNIVIDFKYSLNNAKENIGRP